MNAAVHGPVRHRFPLKGTDAVEFQPMNANVTLMLQISSLLHFHSLPEPDA